MLYTTGQLRAAFNLSKQQWRSYRGALSPLAKDQGRAPCFTAADLVATGVIHLISSSLSTPLSVLSPVAESLFQTCAACSWPQLERSNLLIDFATQRVELTDSERVVAPRVGLLIELAPLVADLRRTLLAGELVTQRDLAFPPMIAGSRP